MSCFTRYASPCFGQLEYLQWEIRMVNFLNQHNRKLYCYIVNGSYATNPEVASCVQTLALLKKNLND